MVDVEDEEEEGEDSENVKKDTARPCSWHSSLTEPAQCEIIFRSERFNAVTLREVPFSWIENIVFVIVL